jgi:hypothetical protein
MGRGQTEPGKYGQSRTDRTKGAGGVRPPVCIFDCEVYLFKTVAMLPVVIETFFNPAVL